MKPEELRSALDRILAHSPAFPGESLIVEIVANPRAGGFTRPAFAKKRFAELARLETMAADLPLRSFPVTVRLHLTERSGHASDIARGIALAARSDAPGLRRLILTAGGDGTSLEVACILAELPPAEADRLCILRLPFGTGNDGSEGRDLMACLGRLLGPVEARPRSALRVVPNPAGGKAALLSFNIASIGLDAFVSQMTNRLKSFFPGNSYKLWVDFSAIFYDRIWPTSVFHVRGYDAAGRETGAIDRELLLLAMGASGRRTYGANQPILPDDDNVCGVFQIPLLKKLEFKERISTGKHRGLDTVVQFFNAKRMVIEHPKAILLQRDGEVSRLDAADFPLVMEVTEPFYRVIEAAEGSR